MKVLTFSTLFPNQLQPNNAVFIKNRMSAVCKFCNVELKVVAPVPFFPPIKVNPQWYQFSKIKKFEILDGIEVHHPRYLVTPKIGMIFYGLNMFLGSINVVKKIYNTFPFDIIDAHYIYPDGFAAILLGKTFNKPVVLSARGTDINVYPRFKLIKKVIRYVLKNSTSIISVCSSLKEIIVALGIPGDKIHVIPNGIDKDKFYKIDSVDARKRLNLPNEKKMLLSVGSLRELKGHHILIDAIGVLKKNGMLDFCTFIIGNGQYKELLEKKIKKMDLEKDIYLVGQVSNDELVYWYNAAHIFFLGSSREGWPNVISEALACGIPVVATGINGIPEIITSKDYGILVERKAEDFAFGIHKALEKKWDYEKIYMYGQARSWETVANEVHQIFQEALIQRIDFR